MLLTGYSLEIFKSKCRSEARGVHCYAHLSEDISRALPYLNTVLGGFVYTQTPPSLMIKNYGKLITIHARKIAVNALKDEKEADKIIAWLQREINYAWEKRSEITPSTESLRQPVLMEVIKLLPRTNCRECGESTCLVFASRAVEGSVGHEDCLKITQENKEKLKDYLSQFTFGY